MNLSTLIKLLTPTTLFSVGLLQAATYHVSPLGNHNGNGSKERPFLSIQQAADIMQAGDTCLIAAGRYRESIVLKQSGSAGRPITFKAVEGAEVIIDGTDPITSSWQKGDNGTYTTQLTKPPLQLFYKNQPMMWARFPNMQFEQNWIENKKWALTESKTEVGKVNHSALADLPSSLEGGLFFIKLGKGNNCFSRKITQHTTGSKTLRWDSSQFLDNPKLTAEDGQSEKIKAAGLVSNRFFIKGSKALLDAEHEWFHDTKLKQLSFIPPHKQTPKAGEISVKSRSHGMRAELVGHLHLEGIDFFACSLHFDKVRNITLRDCHFSHPYELHDYHDNVQVVKKQHPVYILGENNRLEKCLVQYSPGTSLYITGRNNIVTDSIVCEGSRHGRHNDPNITLRYDHRKGYGKEFQYQQTDGNSVTHCTIYNGSGIGVYLLGKGPSTAAYNHVFNVGQYCTDVSALYIPLGRDRRWTGFHHNWVHDINGIGVRCDQDGEQVIFHHNVVWNCKAGGKANGYNCRIYNNTIFVNNRTHPFLTVLQGQDELMTHWPVQNNTAFRLADRRDLREMKRLTKAEKKKRPFILDLQESPSIHHNLIIKPQQAQALFVSVDEDQPDLRPKVNSALIDAGTAVKGINDDFLGKAPDIGAYEFGGKYWTAGASWWPAGQNPPATMAEATQRAHKMSREIRFYKSDHTKYRNQ